MNKPTEKQIIANALRHIAMNWHTLDHLRGPEAIHECANDLDPPAEWFEKSSEKLLEIVNRSRITRGLSPFTAALAVEAGATKPRRLSWEEMDAAGIDYCPRCGDTEHVRRTGSPAVVIHCEACTKAIAEGSEPHGADRRPYAPLTTSPASSEEPNAS